MLTLQYTYRQFCNIDYRIKEYGGWWQNYIVRGLLQKQQMNNIKMVQNFTFNQYSYQSMLTVRVILDKTKPVNSTTQKSCISHNILQNLESTSFNLKHALSVTFGVSIYTIIIFNTLPYSLRLFVMLY